MKEVLLLLVGTMGAKDRRGPRSPPIRPGDGIPRVDTTVQGLPNSHGAPTSPGPTQGNQRASAYSSFSLSFWGLLILTVLCGSVNATTTDSCCYAISMVSSENGYALVNVSLYDAGETDLIFDVEVNLPSYYSWDGNQPYEAPIGTVTCDSGDSGNSTIYSGSSTVLTCSASDALYFTSILHLYNSDTTNLTSTSVINDIVLRHKLKGSSWMSCDKRSFCNYLVPNDGSSDGKMSFGAFGRHKSWFIIVLVVCFGVLAAIVFYIGWKCISGRHKRNGMENTEKSLAKRLRNRRSKSGNRSPSSFNDDSGILNISGPQPTSFPFDKKPTNEYDFTFQPTKRNGSLDPFEGVEGRPVGPAPFSTIKQMNTIKPQFEAGTLITTVEAMNNNQRTDLTAGPNRGGYIVSPVPVSPARTVNNERVLERMAPGVAVDLSDPNFGEAETASNTPYTISGPSQTSHSTPAKHHATLIDQVIAGAIHTQNMTNNTRGDGVIAPPRRNNVNGGSNQQQQQKGRAVNGGYPGHEDTRRGPMSPLIAPEQVRNGSRRGLQVDTSKLIGNAGTVQYNQQRQRHQQQQQQQSVSRYNTRSKSTATTPVSGLKQRQTQSRGPSQTTTPARGFSQGFDDTELSFGSSSAVRQSPTLDEYYYASILQEAEAARGMPRNREFSTAPPSHNAVLGRGGIRGGVADNTDSDDDIQLTSARVRRGR